MSRISLNSDFRDGKEFETGRVPGLLALAGMELELSELLGGQRVDLRTAEDLSRYFRDEVVRTAEVQYAR
jgi:predicted nucleotidyltransferase